MGAPQQALAALGGAVSLSPPVFVSSALTRDTGGTTTHNVTMPTGILAGDLLIAMHLCTSGTITRTPPSGWTEQIDQGSFPDFGITTKVADGTESGTTPNWVHSSGGGTKQTLVLCYRTAAIDVVGAIGTNTSSNANVLPSVTLTEANSTLLALFGQPASNSTYSTPSGMSLLYQDNDANSPSMAVFEETGLSAGATGTRTGDPSGSGGHAGVLIGLKPA